jgi:hypothetical protein
MRAKIPGRNKNERRLMVNFRMFVRGAMRLKWVLEGIFLDKLAVVDYYSVGKMG